MTDLAPQPTPTIIPAPVEPRREYVAGSALLTAYVNAVRALPHSIDDIEAEFGDAIYARMLTDPRVDGDVGLIIDAALEDGVTLTPHPDDADGAIAAFVQRSLDGLSIPLDDVLHDLGHAIAYGSRVAEKVYALAEDGDDKGLLVLKALKVKPRKLTSFVVDAYLNVVGLLAARPGQPVALTGTYVPAADGTVQNLLPRDKFVILSYRPKDSDPRGSTVLRAAYNWWWLKTQFLPEFLKLGVQFGTPSLVGTTEQHAVPDPSQPDKSPEDLLLAKLIQFQNGTALALPFGAAIQVIESAKAGGSDFFTAAIEFCDRQISQAILGTTRATGEAQHGSRADSGTAKDLFDTTVRALRQSIARVVCHDIIEPLICLNYGPDACAMMPAVSLGGAEEADKADQMNAVANLERAGYLDPEQYPEIDAMLSLPVRSAESVARRQARKDAPPPPPAFGPPAPAPGPPADPSADPSQEPTP